MFVKLYPDFLMYHRNVKWNLVSQKEYLEQLYRSYGPGYLATDPLKFVRRFEAPRDREIVGLVTAGLAYGIVEQIFNSLEWILKRIGGHPEQFVRQFDPRRDGKIFNGFVHRFNRGRDLACLFWWQRQILEKEGSLEKFFLRGYRKEDPTIRLALTSFVERMLTLDNAGIYGHKVGARHALPLPASARVRFFLPNPRGGGACKRLNLFLRWMVRRDDGIDLGVWRSVSPAKLVIPLDTHVISAARRLRLTRRKTPDWKMAEEITSRLKRLDPDDPLKYDFSLCRLGMMQHWPLKRAAYLLK